MDLLSFKRASAASAFQTCVTRRQDVSILEVSSAPARPQPFRPHIDKEPGLDPRMFQARQRGLSLSDPGDHLNRNLLPDLFQARQRGLSLSDKGQVECLIEHIHDLFQARQRGLSLSDMANPFRPPLL